jgi:hypothetical protein
MIVVFVVVFVVVDENYSSNKLNYLFEMKEKNEIK